MKLLTEVSLGSGRGLRSRDDLKNLMRTVFLVQKYIYDNIFMKIQLAVNKVIVGRW